MYQVLFTIEYKNKKFTIFNTEHNRKTFLELTEDGEYIYPTLADFIELHNIYNCNKYECYDIKFYNKDKAIIIPHLQPKTKVTFKEAVRTTAGVICIVALAFGMAASMHSQKFVLSFEDNNFTVTRQIMESAKISDTTQLDKILGYDSVSKQTIIEAIKANENIPNDYKEDAIKLLEYISNKYPDTDMRIYYENIKRMEIIEPDYEHQYALGTFSPDSGAITIYPNHGPTTLTHELGHSWHHIIFREVFPIYRIEDDGRFLDEAYTNKITSGIHGTVNTSIQVRRVLDYFLECVSYTYYDYERYGIKKLITMLEEKYPSVDINYIIESMDAITDTLYSNEKTPKIEEVEPLLDTFFDICLANINEGAYSTMDLYKPFEKFIRLIDYNKYPELVNKYFDYYNNVLLGKGVSKDMLLETSDFIIDRIKTNEAAKGYVRDYLTTIDKNGIKEEDLYANFRELAYNIPGLTIEDVLDMLDIYNDFLYCNGFNHYQTINREDIESKIINYQYVYAVVAVDGILYPYIKEEVVKGTDGATIVMYDVLHENGWVVKLPTRSIQTTQNWPSNDANRLLNIFGKYQFGSQEFWQNYSQMSQLGYKKVPIYNGGKLICETYLSDVYLVFTKTEEGIGFVLCDSNFESIAYSANSNVDETLKNRKIFCSLYPYVQSLDNYLERQSIDLQEIFNEEYLKKKIIATTFKKGCSSVNYPELFYNFESDKVEMHPSYVINMELQGNVVSGSLSFCYLYDGKVYFAARTIIEDIELDYAGEVIYFEEVLRYYGILNMEDEYYEFSTEQMCELYRQYITMLNQKEVEISTGQIK